MNLFLETDDIGSPATTVGCLNRSEEGPLREDPEGAGTRQGFPQESWRYQGWRGHR